MIRLPFTAARIAALGRLSAEINAAAAPPPIDHAIEIGEDGRVVLPVPDHDPPTTVDPDTGGILTERKYIAAELHPGCTLQWAPVPGHDGVIVEIRGGAPDGVEGRDGVAMFLTATGLRGLARDLSLIAATLGAAS